MAVGYLYGALVTCNVRRQRRSVKSNRGSFPPGRSRLYRSPANEIVRKRFAAVVAATATATAIATATANVVATTKRE